MTLVNNNNKKTICDQQLPKIVFFKFYYLSYDLKCINTQQFCDPLLVTIQMIVKSSKSRLNIFFQHGWPHFETYKSLGPVSNKDLSQNVFYIRHGLTNLSGQGIPILLPRMSINHHVRPKSLRISRWNFVQLHSSIIVFAPCRV